MKVEQNTAEVSEKHLIKISIDLSELFCSTFFKSGCGCGCGCVGLLHFLKSGYVYVGVYFFQKYGKWSQSVVKKDR